MKCTFYSFHLIVFRHKEVSIYVPLMLDLSRSRFCKSSHLLTSKHLKSYKYGLIILFSFRLKKIIAAWYHPLGAFESKRYIKEPKNKIDQGLKGALCWHWNNSCLNRCESLYDASCLPIGKNPKTSKGPATGHCSWVTSSFAVASWRLHQEVWQSPIQKKV